MTTQRLIDSMDEAIFTYSIDGDLKNRETFKKSLENIFKRSKAMVEKVAHGTQDERNRALLTRVRHLVPVSMDGRQSINDTATGGSKRAGGNTSIEDGVTNARHLAGALGVNLSLHGFGDQMADGLGEGGFFRTSAQVAERATCSPVTINRVEKGIPTVAIGIYLRVLYALQLEDDILLLAQKDDMGRALQDLALKHRERASKKV